MVISKKMRLEMMKICMQNSKIPCIIYSHTSTCPHFYCMGSSLNTHVTLSSV